MEFKNGNRLLILLNDGTNIRREVAEASNMNDTEEEWQEGVEDAPEPKDAEGAHPTKGSEA